MRQETGDRGQEAGTDDGGGLAFVCLLAAALALAALGATVCQAREPFVEFLRGLQRRGYGEQALAYIDQIAERPDLPPELKETLDLERSKCLRVAAGEANDAQQRAARLAEAKRLAEKFFGEHPTHPAAGDGAAERRGRRAGPRRAAAGPGPRQPATRSVQEKAFVEARQPLTEAREQV